MKLFLPQGANQETHKCTHVVFIGRYHIGPKISGEKKEKKKPFSNPFKAICAAVS